MPSHRPCTPHHHTQGLLGKARALEALQEQRGAWELLSEASIRLPWAVPLHMELARLTLAQQDWGTLAEVVARLQQVDGNNIMALAYQGVLSCVGRMREGGLTAVHSSACDVVCARCAGAHSAASAAGGRRCSGGCTPPGSGGQRGAACGAHQRGADDAAGEALSGEDGLGCSMWWWGCA
jgi:hypothetical protein